MCFQQIPLRSGDGAGRAMASSRPGFPFARHHAQVAFTAILGRHWQRHFRPSLGPQRRGDGVAAAVAPPSFRAMGARALASLAPTPIGDHLHRGIAEPVPPDVVVELPVTRVNDDESLNHRAPSGPVGENVLEALPAVWKQIEQLAPPLVGALDRLAPHEPSYPLDRPWDPGNVNGDFHEVRNVVDGLVGGEGQPGQRDVRETPMKEEQPIGTTDLGHHVRTLLPDRAPALTMAPDGVQIRLGGLAPGPLDVNVLLARFGHAPHDLDVVPGPRELLDQLAGLLTKSLVDHAQLAQVPVRFVALAHLLPKLRRHLVTAGLEPTVGFTQLVELSLDAAHGLPGFAEIPLVFLPLGVEPLRTQW